MTTDSCAACHRTHTGQNQWLATAPLPQSQQCFVCHNGLGADSNTQGQWATAPANDANTASYYQHPSTAANSGHTNALDTEFAGVLNRHAECSDCHNPHNPTATTLLAASTGAGWLVSGATRNGSGVKVTNGAAATAPSYGWLSTPPKDESGDIFPQPVGQIQYEYQLCFKCHAGYTKLIATTGAPISSHPSWWSLDKGIELNPANKGVHPIEGPGTNTTTQLGNSLTPLPGANTTYRIWQMTTASVVRCSQCHGTPAQTPTGPNASSGVRLDTHVSPNRGVLRANYRDRIAEQHRRAVSGDRLHPVLPVPLDRAVHRGRRATGRTRTSSSMAITCRCSSSPGYSFDRDIDTPERGIGSRDLLRVPLPDALQRVQVRQLPGAAERVRRGPARELLARTSSGRAPSGRSGGSV